MSARVFILIMSLVSFAYRCVLMRLADLQRRRPLPAEVADVFEPERYQTYLNYTADNRRFSVVQRIVTLVIDTAVWFSPLFGAVERAAGGNAYVIFLLTFLVFWAVETVCDVIFGWYDTFRIEEKYGLNKKDGREFAKDEIIEAVTSFLLIGVLGLILTFFGEHLPVWTGGRSVGAAKAVLTGAVIAGVIALFFVLATLFSYRILRLRYTFTPLPEGPLRDEIMRLQEGSKKRVHEIYVYNESKKSTSKNAFLLKLFFHREFGIADNFLTGNSERELLAVLSHEVGHLKHKKTVLNIITYAVPVLLFVILIALIARPQPVLALTAWVRTSFGVVSNNYYALISVVISVLLPVIRVAGIFSNYRSRSEEYEADREAVKNGYGEELIETFKRVSSDELVNVDPHPAIEILEYNHPGMYRRIKAIREAADALEYVPEGYRPAEPADEEADGPADEEAAVPAEPEEAPAEDTQKEES
ncbi:MAG: M48 family metallopeptidase [Lachnospiraceae bacterium]|nr:M48 family metallopeptidase [Lachnospiraceae bacterium]